MNTVTAISDACLVVLTDALYLPGTRRLIESWRLHNPALPIIALSIEEGVLEDSFLRAVCESRILIDASGYADIHPYKKRRSRRHAQTFFKFEAFRDFGFERNLFLDSDLLCLRAAPALLKPGNAPLRAALDTGFRRTRSYKGHAQEINSGVLSIGRAIIGSATVAGLKAIARVNPGRGGYNAGDQGILNKWLHAEGISIERIPSEYNLIKKDYAETEGLARCRLLHFAGAKPWIEPRGKDASSYARESLERLWHGEPLVA